MAKKDKKTTELSLDEVEALFADVDETGHTNASKARKERARRRNKKAGVDVDPLSGDDPSGSNVGKTMTRAAIVVVGLLLAVIIIAQVSCGVIRRAGTAQLANHVDNASVSSALRNGVEWGDGFTQFPEDYTVLEANEESGRIEVTVVDTSSADELECLAGSQIQAAALSVNALLNPQITQVVYHVDVHVDEDGKFMQSEFFGFFKPKGGMKRFATFIWTKSSSNNGGFNFNCMITGLDETAAENLRDKVTVQGNLLDAVLGTAATTDAATTDAAATDSAEGDTAEGDTAAEGDGGDGSDDATVTENAASEADGETEAASN